MRRSTQLLALLIVTTSHPHDSFATNALPDRNPTAALNGYFGKEFAWPIIPIHVSLLPNGKVFSYGTDEQGNQGAQFNYSVWDPKLGEGPESHTLLPNTYSTDIFCSGSSLLPGTGDVLVSGGDTRYPDGRGITSALLFKTGDQSLDRSADMKFARWYPTTIALPNGEILVHGGRDGSANPVATPEIFNQGQWRTLWGATNGEITSWDESRWMYPRNFVSPNGKVFGLSGNLMYWVDWQGEGSTELLGTIPNKSRSNTSTAVMYRPGHILQVGGSTNGDIGARGSNQAITVDVTGSTPLVVPAPNMARERVWANSTVLPNGEVLVTGGSAFENKLVDTAKVAELWNPDTRQFRQVAEAALPRLYHSVSLLLPDATVLIAGGGAPGPLTNRNGEIFYPPYLFDAEGKPADRLSIGEMKNRVGYDEALDIPVHGTGRVKRVSLVRAGAVTHSFDTGQRFLELPFTQGRGFVHLKTPVSPNLAPPGYYMLFVLNENGTPSIGRILNIGGDTVPPPPAETKPDSEITEAPKVGSLYSIASRYNPSSCIDVAGGNTDNGGRVQIYQCNGTSQQNFRVVQAAGEGFHLVNENSGKCIDIAGISLESGADLQQWECAGGANQTYAFAPSTAGSFILRFAHSDKCLDIQGPNSANGSTLHQWECMGNLSQDWLFKETNPDQDLVPDTQFDFSTAR